MTYRQPVDLLADGLEKLKSMKTLRENFVKNSPGKTAPEIRKKISLWEKLACYEQKTSQS